MSNDDYLKCSCKECGNHIEFPKESAGTVAACPHCGQWTELTPDTPLDEAVVSNRKGVRSALLLGCVVLAAAATAFFVLRNRANIASQPPAQPTKVAAMPANPPPTNPAPVKPVVAGKPQKSLDDLKVSPVQLEKAKVGSLVYAVGTVTNVSEYQRFGVQIELNLFGKNGKKLGVAKDYKDILEPGHEWQFHALIPDPRTVSAKVSSLKED
jgi:hypothetical protein